MFDADTLQVVLGGIRKEFGESWFAMRVEELMMNAAEHSSEGRGEVSVKCLSGGGAVATVTDSGPGIPSTMKRRHEGKNHELLWLALSPGATSLANKRRGYGLYGVVGLAGRDGFSVYLESGSLVGWTEGGGFKMAPRSNGEAGTLVRLTRPPIPDDNPGA